MTSSLWDYQVTGAAKPFAHPVRLPSGVVISTDRPSSHPWHHGLWFAIKYVNGDNFWEEVDAFGTVESNDAASGALAWRAPDGSTVLVERRSVDHVQIDTSCYAIDWDIELTAAVAVVLDREPYNGLWGGYSGIAFRGRGDWTGTRLLCSDGGETDRLEGVPGAWLDLSGPIDGDEGGIALFDAPSNARHPVPWYASTKGLIYGDEWGNFMNAALLWNDPLRLVEGDRLRLRYRALVHQGLLDRDQLADAYDRYCVGLS